jgi:ABC-2 type transport system permease protein
MIDIHVVRALARRTFSHAVKSPIAYVVAIFFYGFVGGIFGLNYFLNGQAAMNGVSVIAPWVLWFVIPALTMGLISEELRSGTFELLSTLPVRDWEIVLGKFLGFAILAASLVVGFVLYIFLIGYTTNRGQALQWGPNLGVIAGLYLVCLAYGAMGIFASSLARNQVVALILGMIFCTLFFFVGQFVDFFPGFWGRIADFVGTISHLQTFSKGVWDIRDVLYFGSVIFLFLYLTVQRLATRRF